MKEKINFFGGATQIDKLAASSRDKKMYYMVKFAMVNPQKPNDI